MLIPRTAGALSAFGGQHSDVVYEVGAGVYTDSADFDVAALEVAFAAIGDSLARFGDTLAGGVDERPRSSASSRRATRIRSGRSSCRSASSSSSSAGAVDGVVDAFHDLHERIFAVRDPGQRVEILQCRGPARRAPAAAAARERPPARAHGRAAARRGARTSPITARSTSRSTRATRSRPARGSTGPLLVTEPSTTVVVPPGATLQVTELGNYLLELA